MIKFEATVNDEKVYLTLDVDDAEQPTAHQITGSAIAQKIFAKALYNSYDMFGHTIGKSSPAIDVYHALFHTPDNKFLNTKIVNGIKYIARWKAATLMKNAVR